MKFRARQVYVDIVHVFTVMHSNIRILLFISRS